MRGRQDFAVWLAIINDWPQPWQVITGWPLPFSCSIPYSPKVQDGLSLGFDLLANRAVQSVNFKCGSAPHVKSKPTD